MAVIAATQFRGVKGPVTITRTVLSAADTLVYNGGGSQVLELFNTTAAAVTVTIDGSAGTTVAAPDGIGGTIDVSAGKAIVVPASSTVYVNLDTIAAYCQGTVNVTGGVGVTAQLTY
jgi:hypothetical protein